MKRHLFFAMSVFVFCMLTLFPAPLVSAESGVGNTVPPAVTLNVAVDGAGTVSVNPPGTTHTYGEIVVLNAAGDPGWSFSHWESQRTPAIPWLGATWAYRVPITVSANGAARADQPAEIDINFTALLAELGVSGAFAPASIRVVELDEFADVVEDEVPFQFEPGSGYNPSTNASGALILMMRGQTGASAERRYHVYFGLNDQSYPAPGFTPPIALTADGVDDEGQAAFKIETLSGTYYYQKTAGGFSSLVDANGNDWIGYNATNGPGGSYRGIPNAVAPASGGHLHPGKTTATTSVVESGPLRVILRSTVQDDGGQMLWDAQWNFYPRHATMTMKQRPADANYWFLYEGTPGGSIGAEDTVTRSDGTQNAIDASWESDLLGDEWVYFADGNLGRSLFLYKHGSDTVVDSYRPYTVMVGGVPVIRMTVFGFGRPLGTIAPKYDSVPNRFTISLTDQTSYDAVQNDIKGVSKGLNYDIDGAEQRLPFAEDLPDANPLSLAMTANRDVTAVFTQRDYNLTITKTGNGGGEVTIEPQKNSYQFGDVVTLTAAPDAGSRFAGWAGAASGSAPTIEITIFGNTAVTANFEQELYTFTVATAGDGAGSAQWEPAKSGYLYGDMVTVTALPAAGSRFVSWSGAGSGSAISTTVTIFDNVTITATFALIPYNLQVEIEGDGSVQRSPEQATYTYGQHVTLAATPAQGNAFVGWDGAISGASSPTTLVIEGDTQVKARFAPLYSVNAAPGDPQQGYVAIRPQKERYVAGETIELQAYAAINWQFMRWTGDIDSTDNPVALTVDADKNIVAEFAQLHDLDVLVSGQGKVVITPESDDKRYPAGGIVTIEAIAETGWHFARWEGDASGESNPLAYEIQQDSRVTAVFEPNTMKVYLPVTRR